MSYGIATQDAKAAYAQQTDARAYPAATAQAPSDPASLRGQLQALAALAERLSQQRCQLREVADFIVGENPPDAIAGRNIQGLASAGGITAEIAGMFQHIAGLLDDTEQQIQRLRRVSS